MTSPDKKDNHKPTGSPWHSVIRWDQVPRWQQDNHYIHGGYRRVSASYRRSFASIWYLHNESVNIWTHLLPAALTIPAGWWLHRTLKPRYEQASARDVAAFSCFFLGAALCLGMSATYHTISNHSPEVNRIGNQLDYVGIVLLISGSFVPSIYYGFWCYPKLQMVYWSMICVLGAICAVVSILPRFRTPTWRPFRATMFVGMGLSAIFPVLHGLQIYGPSKLEDRIGLSWLVLQGVLYILGATIYAVRLPFPLPVGYSQHTELLQARVPEKWYPGRFDVFGSSHQVFHILVVLAALSHLRGLLKAFDFRHSISGSMCS